LQINREMLASNDAVDLPSRVNTNPVFEVMQ
jgi:hypothetical protein